MNDQWTYFITWTTYGTWLPGDARGWRKSGQGTQTPQPRLEQWVRARLTGQPVTLSDSQRQLVESVCREHAALRRWTLHAISVRSNHVHLLVAADRPPNVVRDQFKANATRVLRSGSEQLPQATLWTRGGDCEIVDGDENRSRVAEYITEAQDRKHRDP